MSFHMLCAIGSFAAALVLYLIGCWDEYRRQPEVLPEPARECQRNGTECVP